MILKHRKQQRLFVWIVLVQGSDGHPGPLRDAGGGQSVCSVAKQNLNSRLTNRPHRDRRPRLNGHFPWLKCSYYVSRHMRTPNLKNPSSNDLRCTRKLGGTE